MCKEIFLNTQLSESNMTCKKIIRNYYQLLNPMQMIVFTSFGNEEL